MKPFEARKRLWNQLFHNPKVLNKSSHSLSQLLRGIPIFDGLSSWQIKRVSELLYQRHFEPGEYLFEVSHPGAALFLIHTGIVSVELKDGDNNTLVLAELEPGSFIGELALLDQSPRSASARAIETTVAYALFRNDLEDLALKEPQITSLIYRALASVIGERLKATNELLKLEKINLDKAG